MFLISAVRTHLTLILARARVGDQMGAAWIVMRARTIFVPMINKRKESKKKNTSNHEHSFSAFYARLSIKPIKIITCMQS
jgi:hypothetical protein